MKNCIEHLKAYPHELHEGCIQQLMLEKWSARPSRGGYGERAVAQKWGASWGNSEWTLLRSGLHTHGGLPPDNQGLEGKNGSQKETLAAWRRRQLTVFVPMFFPWMENESLEDLQFGMGLPRAKCGVKEIHSTLFYASVEDELLRQQAGTGIFACLFADATDREVMFIPSRRTITTLLEDHAVTDTKAALRKALSVSATLSELSWLETYTTLAAASTIGIFTQQTGLVLDFDSVRCSNLVPRDLSNS